MEKLAEAVRFAHVIVGVVGLAAFWVPIFSRKGGGVHVRFGRIFVRCAYFVLATAAASVGYRLYTLWSSGLTPTERPEAFAIFFFLGYLSFITFIIIRHAIGALRTRGDPSQLATKFNLTLSGIAPVTSVALIAFALIYAPDNAILLYALSPLGFSVSFGNLRYLLKKHHEPREWFYEHMANMLAAGIAFHTAFAVFGSARIIDLALEGWIQVIPWVAPTVIGVPAIFLWRRYYSQRFAAAGVAR